MFFTRVNPKALANQKLLHFLTDPKSYPTQEYLGIPRRAPSVGGKYKACRTSTFEGRNRKNEGGSFPTASDLFIRQLNALDMHILYAHVIIYSCLFLCT